MRYLLIILLLLSACNRGGGAPDPLPEPVSEPVPEPVPAPEPPPPPTASLVEWLTADATPEQVCPVDQSGFRIYPVVEGVWQAPVVVPFNAANCIEHGAGTCGAVYHCHYEVPQGTYQITGYDSFGIESVPSGLINGG